jgi:hypothetical protein
MRSLLGLRYCTLPRRIGAALLSLGVLCSAPGLGAQEIPLISGGVGFLTNTNAGSTSYQTVAVPVLAAPIGQHLLVEARGNLLESFSPRGNGDGYDTSHFLAWSYVQADYIATSHMTLVGGYFLIPFGTYNERLSPIWISNLQDAPLIYPIGTMGSTAGLGGQVRGNLFSSENVSISYAAYVSTGSTNKQFQSSRSAGGQGYVYFPKARLEIGASYGRLREDTHSNAYGAHVWWEPAKIPLKIRSEYAHGPNSQGYWIETDYRLSQFHGADSLIGRLEPVFRLQQTIRNGPDPTDGLPAANTQRTDFGLDYHLPHEVRINTSYARQFSSAGNFNVWETGVVYRFLFPTWRGK